MSIQVLKTGHRAVDMRLPDGRLFDFEMPEDVPATDVPAPGGARGGSTPSPLSGESPPRRAGRLALAAALVMLVTASTAGVLAFVHVRADMAAQRRTVVELLDRAETAEESLSELGRQERAAAAASASLTSQLSGLTQAQFDVAGVARRVQPSVVTITTPRGLGSGFAVLSRDGTSNIVTSFHVVADVWTAGGRTVSVRLRNGAIQGTIATVSEENDLALVTIASTLPTITAAGGSPGIGDPVLVAGSPRGLEGTVTSGIVSHVRSFAGTPFIQVSAPTSPGNSGGPVVDRSGKVLGVVTMKDVAPGTEGLTFAISISRVCAALAAC